MSKFYAVDSLKLLPIPKCQVLCEAILLQLVVRDSPKSRTSTPETVAGSTQNIQTVPKSIDIPLNCSLGNLSRACPANYYPSHISVKDKACSSNLPPSCPDYFRWIHEDLWPWRETGITKEMVMSARPTANFRLVVVDGKAYVETYRKSFQSRDTFTLWGILQLLRRYPGKVPDLDLMFDCVDWPVIKKETFKAPEYPAPPPLFRYCGNDSTFDIVFPDWSFWGWYVFNWCDDDFDPLRKPFPCFPFVDY